MVPSTQKQQKFLQLAASNYLTESYEIFKARGFEWFEATLDLGLHDEIGQPMDMGQI